MLFLFWGFKCQTDLESVPIRAIRYFMGVHRFAPHLALYGDIRWLPSTQRRWLHMVRFWNRLLTFDDNRLTKRVFLYDYENDNHNNWCSEIKRIFSYLNILNYYENKLVVNMDSVKQKLFDFYAGSWPDEIRQTPKLRTYVTFKTEFKTEEYTKMKLQRNDRSILAQFCCGILPIRIETGRFVGERPEERPCKLCDPNVPGDERHFLLECTTYNNLRQYWFPHINNNQFSNLDASKRLALLVRNFP